MKRLIWAAVFLITVSVFGLAGCGPDRERGRLKEILSKPKAYVGSEQCQFCHLEHYDSWKNTLHSRTMQDVTENRDALIAEIDPDAIRADLKAIEKDLKVPVD